MKNLLSLSILLFLVSSGFAQIAPEYGNSSEMRGLTKLYVNTQGDIRNRNRIIKKIRKAKTRIQIVNRAEEAQLVMVFVGNTTSLRLPYDPCSDDPYRARYKRVRSGNGSVAIRGKGEWSPVRVLMNFESVQNKLFESKPATKFAKRFLKKWKMANRNEAVARN